MTPERWEQVKALFQTALERDPPMRSTFLAEACGDDAELRREVESLLASHERSGSLIETPAASLAHADAAGPATPTLGPGTRLGPYEVSSLLGAGGMGEVYRARDSRLGREVAVKVLTARASSDPQALRRFEQEARAAGALNHPNIVGVHDVGSSEGALYVVSELLEGETLRDCLDEEALPVGKAVEYAVQMAHGLAAAHEKGIVHRDLKPENIFVTTDGRIKILDFGIAKLREPSPATGPGSPYDRATDTEAGRIVGTAGYMSPEQVRSQPADHRSDIFAFGAVLYEMLAGRRAFAGETPADVLMAVLKDEVPGFTGRSIPPPLERIVRRCLERRPAERFQSAHDLALALQVVSPLAETAARAPVARRASVALAAGLATVLVAGVVVLWRRDRAPAPASAPHGVKALAVLPFENLGQPDDEYFADGVTDEVRGKLSALPGLMVIASTSSNQYRKTTKTPAQIGSELGVTYLLVGKVRWEKRMDGTSRIRVSPELVDAATASTKWQQSFDAVLNDVFEVQATVSRQVAEALGLALGDAERGRLAGKPTANLAAYQAYLRGNEAMHGFESPEQLRRAIDHHERAVALDPGFALAWAQLSRAHTALHMYAEPTAANRERALASAERAISLAPDLPSAHFALAVYYGGILVEWPRAREEFAVAMRNAPHDAELLTEAARAQQSTGHWEEAVTYLRRALDLDPRSTTTARRLTHALLCVRRHSEALEAADKGLSLAPRSVDLIERKVMVILAQGDLAGARAVLESVPDDVDPTALVAHVATWWDLFWVLDDEQQQLLLRLLPGSFADDRLAWGLALAQTAELRGDMVKAREFAEEARTVARAQVAQAPAEAQRHALLGLALALLGRKDEAVRAGEHAAALLPLSKDAYTGAYLQHQLARIYRRAGETEKALSLLEELLGVPYYLSPGWLRIDPEWESLRDHPRFKKLASMS